MEQFDPKLYEILGRISREASQEDIKKAYYALAKVYHSDVNKHHTYSDEESMKELNKAYEILKNPEKRKKYNEDLHSYEEQIKREEDEKVRQREAQKRQQQARQESEKKAKQRQWNSGPTPKFADIPNFKFEKDDAGALLGAVIAIGLLALLFGAMGNEKK